MANQADDIWVIDESKLCSGWHDDPYGIHQLRYFDGTAWTEHLTHFGPTPCTGCANPGSSEESNGDRTDDSGS